MKAFLRTGTTALRVLLILFLIGCRTIDGTYGLPPFYEVYPTPSSVEAEGQEGSEVLVRPFWSYETSERGSHRLRSFPPFLDCAWSPDESRYWLFPIFAYRSFLQPLGGRDIDWMLVPFLFGGSDPEEGSYFAVFPFGGRVKGLLAHDEIDFALFPLYWRWTTGERESLHILWPFYNRVQGGDWSGWRLWPFYGRFQSRTREGEIRYDRGFVFWPFYIRGREELNIEPTDLFFTFPFYGERVNRLAETRTYLWPFFQTHHDKKADKRTYLGFLFHYRIADDQTDIWPLFGFKETSRQSSMGGDLRKRNRHFILWPIERYDWASDGREEMTRFWFLPLFWRFHYVDKESLETRTEWKVWPLCHYRSRDGKVQFNFLSPLWFFRETYDRYYTRWFAVFRYRWTSRVSGWEALYGAIMYRSERPEVRTDGKPQAEVEGVFSILGGFFACGSRGGKLVLRLLYIPWW